MKIAVSGTNGFIGKNLVKVLARLGHTPYFILREDYANPKKLKEDLEYAAPQVIIHLAAYGNHSDQKDIDTMIHANIYNTYWLLNATRKINYVAFLNISSSSVYGIKDHPMKETDSLDTTTFYGATKAAAELISNVFAIQNDKPVVNIRPFSVYGPGEADFRFMPTVIKHLIHGGAMPLAPEPKHDWIYIDDFISGLSKVIDYAEQYKARAINIGTGQQYSNVEIVKMLEKIANKTLSVDVFTSMRKYDHTSWVANNEQLLSTGWRQKFPIERGLKITYEYYKSKYQK